MEQRHEDGLLDRYLRVNMSPVIDATATVWRSPANAATPKDGSVPLVLLLHGRGSNERDLPGLVQYLPKDVVYASLRAPFSVDSGWGWFPPASVTSWRRPAEQYREGAAAILDWLDATAPEAHIIPIGFSQGAAMAAQLVRMEPKRVLGAGILSGFVHAESEPGDGTETKVFIGHGDQDTIVPLASAQTTRQLFKNSEYIEGHGVAHELWPEEVKALANYLAELVTESH